MEYIAAAAALALIAALFNWFMGSGGPADNRETNLKDRQGRPLALLCAGPMRGDGYDTPDHESIIHGGTPHQNPAVIERIEWNIGAGLLGLVVGLVVGFLLAPGIGTALAGGAGFFVGLLAGSNHYQFRYYPLTVNAAGILPDIGEINRRIATYPLGRGQRLEVVPMPGGVATLADIVESGQQLARGVEANQLRGKVGGMGCRYMLGQLLGTLVIITVMILAVLFLLGLLTMAGGGA